VKNKAKPEGSIVNAYLRKEIVIFCSYYFPPKDSPSRNADTFKVQEDHDTTLSVFRVSGREVGKEDPTVWFTEKEWNEAHYYVLMNCKEVDKYREIFAG
jgi:hypothetical protein